MIRFLLISLLALVTVIAIAAVWLWPRNPYTPPIQHEVAVERLPGNPLIHAGLDEVLEAQASARPMPEPAPVMTATFPEKFFMPPSSASLSRAE